MAIFFATDEEDEDSELMWSLSGADGGKFDINETGATVILTFKASPDFEAPGDANRNNVYEVTAFRPPTAGPTPARWTLP